jgi:hypothetical protein
MDKEYYCRHSVGLLEYDPGHGTKHFVEWWALLKTDPGIVDFHCWLSKRNGVPLQSNKLWGSHVSAVKGEEPKDGTWGKDFGEIEFWYSNVIRYDNGAHAWLDVWCPKLHDIRDEFGLSRKVDFGGHPRHFHLTLGRYDR